MTNDNTYAGGDGYPYGYGDGSDRAQDPYQEQIPGHGHDHSHDHSHGHGHGYVQEYGNGYDHGGFGYGQGDAYGYGYGYGSGYDFAAGPAGEGHYAPGSAEGWGGEYDADATGFVQLPPGGWAALDPQAGGGAEAYGDPLAGPLAAPGTGQGGYTPPPIEVTQPGAGSRGPAGTDGTDGMGGGPLTPGATTDPAMTGHWLMPYQAETPPAPVSYGESEVPPAPGLPESSEPAPGEGESGSTAAAMGQGAAAALAGSHEARTKRRPLGEGGGAGVLPPDAFDPQPQSPPQAQPLSESQSPQSEAPPGQAAQPSDELFADAQARRQVPFEGGVSDTGVAAAGAQDAGEWEAGFGHGAYAEPFASVGQEEQQRTEPAEPVEQAPPEPAAPAAGSSGGSAIPWTPSVPGRTAGAPPVSGGGWGGTSGDTFAEAMPENGATQNEPAPGEPAPGQPAPGEPTMEGPDPDYSATDPSAAEPTAMGEPAPGGPAPGDAVPGEPSDPAQPQAGPSWPEPGQLGQAEPEWPEPGVPAQGQRGLADFDTVSPDPPVAGEAAEALAGHQPVPGQAWPVPGETVPGQEGAPQQSPDHGGAAPADSVPADSAPADPVPVTAEQGSEPGPEGPAPSLPEQTVPGQAVPQHEDPHGDSAPEAPAAGVPAQTRPAHDADAQEAPGHEAPGHEVTGNEAPGHETPGHGTPLPEDSDVAVDGVPGQEGPASGGFEAPESGDIEVPADEAAVPAPVGDEHPHTSYVLHVNGVDRPVTGAWIGESLLYVLRERLGLAGAKDGCSQGECGACSVQVDGRLVASCLVPAATSAGTEIRTVEGLAADGTPSDVQRALADCGAVQCGFCVPGLAMTVHDLLEGNHAPSELETRSAICGNLCRCSGYSGVLDAVRTVVDERRARAAREAEESAEQHAQQHPDEAAGHPERARIPQQGGPGGGMHYPGGGGA